MTAGPVTVLVLDDERLIRRLLTDFLEMNGMITIPASCGEEGLGMLREKPADAAIVDVRLPDMDGNEFIVRASRIRPALKFIIHTGSLDYRLPDELTALGIGEESVVHKPVRDMKVFGDIIMRLTGAGSG